MLTLSAASTYQLLVIGYNRSDYDFASGGGATKRFNIGSTGNPATLANLYLQPVNPAVVPEFFSCFETVTRVQRWLALFLNLRKSIM